MHKYLLLFLLMNCTVVLAESHQVNKIPLQPKEIQDNLDFSSVINETSKALRVLEEKYLSLKTRVENNHNAFNEFTISTEQVFKKNSVDFQSNIAEVEQKFIMQIGHLNNDHLNQITDLKNHLYSLEVESKDKFRVSNERFVDAENILEEHKKELEKLNKAISQLHIDLVTLDKKASSSTSDINKSVQNNWDKYLIDRNDSQLFREKNKDDINALQLEIGVANRNIWLVSIMVLFAALIATFIAYTRSLKLITNEVTALRTSLQKTTDADSQNSIQEKIFELIEVNLSNSSEKQNDDHSLALKVADEIARVEKNISRMDAGTKGLKQISASIKRIQDNFSSNGYEIVEMLNKPYTDGLNASVNFVPDNELDEGQQIITRVIKPQVNYKGVMIQPAQIEVSQGE